jgi:hypothetical protein
MGIVWGGGGGGSGGASAVGSSTTGTGGVGVVVVMGGHPVLGAAGVGAGVGRRICYG